eukprot:GHVS01056330.1.p1 GENE.GHVS01056330.1~~GHVS01056330.1.p1  ORF type:complete len:421 (-),score=74.81 GHVS01056330.1:670-1932(-)
MSPPFDFHPPPFSVTAVAAVSYPCMGLGNEGGLPWCMGEFPVDQQMFKQLTTHHRGASSSCDAMKYNAVIMGRKTWDSLPRKRKPLPGRLNVVLSRSCKDKVERECPNEMLCVCASLEEALKTIREQYAGRVEQTFIIGGAELYSAALSSGLVTRLYLTRVNKHFPCDSFFPPIDSTQFAPTALSPTHRNKNDIAYDFVIYDYIQQVTEALNPSTTSDAAVDIVESLFGGCRAAAAAESAVADSVVSRKHEEFQYLDIIRDILQSGAQQSDRTGVGVLSKFGCQMRFSLRETFPLLTTKRVYWKGVVEELLWFIRGDTNANHLSALNVKIWDQNATREFLDSQHLEHRQPGDLGPVYGFQWRHFGAQYVDMHTDYRSEREALTLAVVVFCITHHQPPPPHPTTSPQPPSPVLSAVRVRIS